MNMQASFGPKHDIDWKVVKLFPETHFFQGGYGKRIKLGVSPRTGETVAYYQKEEYLGSKKYAITDHLFIIRAGKPFMLEKFRTRYEIR